MSTKGARSANSEPLAPSASVTPRFHEDSLRCRFAPQARSWLTTLDDFRNWLLCEAARCGLISWTMFDDQKNASGVNFEKIETRRDRLVCF